MRLWNILPNPPIEAKEKNIKIIEQYIKNISKFLSDYYLYNNIQFFIVTRIIPCKSDGNKTTFAQNDKITVNYTENIVRGAISDEFGIVLRGEGCRLISFGYDYDAYICVKHSDVMSEYTEGISLSDTSNGLIETDWYDD
jgi:hypothetical protein